MKIANYELNIEDISSISPVHTQEHADFHIHTFTVYMKNGHQYSENSQNEKLVIKKYNDLIKEKNRFYLKKDLKYFIKNIFTR